MRFLKIAFSNYRCFRNGELELAVPSRPAGKKNVILCSWENGGGKTNLMFAFRFALYGMTEAEYKAIPGQERTPWALNQNAYNELAHSGRVGDSVSAWVELSFEYRHNIYTIRRTHIFTRENGKVSGPIEKVVLYIQDSVTGDTSSVCREREDVRRQVERIIPEKTLYAILCDGERVSRLSSTGSETNLAIQAVVARMTEHELLNLVAKGLEKVKRQIHRKITASVTRVEDKQIAVKCANLQKSIENDERACVACEQQIERCKLEMDDISQDLRLIQEVKQLEKERVAEEKRLKSYEIEIEKAQKRLVEAINKQSYWAMAGRLCADINKFMSDSTLRFPGLEASIVDEVMKGEKCICGRTIDEHIRGYMAVLRKQLPPFNVDAILSEILHKFGSEDRREEYRSIIAERVENINVAKRKANESMEIIADLRKRIEASQNPNARALELKRESLSTLILKSSQDIAVRQAEIARSKTELLELDKQLKEISKKVLNGEVLERRLDLLEGAESGIARIKKSREEEALTIINESLANAFRELRSASDAQRQIYITQFEDEHRLIVYHEARVNKALAYSRDKGDAKLREQLILKNATSSSTGQLKMTSLAFMKAILDYVRSIAAKDKNLSDAEYPVIMDAPFSDIKGENYDNAVMNVRTLAKQVILLIADSNVPEKILPYVSKTYTVEKKPVKESEFNDSIIRLVR